MRRRNREGLDSRTKRIIIDATTVNLGPFYGETGKLDALLKICKASLNRDVDVLSRLREMEILFVEFLFAIFFFFFFFLFESGYISWEY